MTCFFYLYMEGFSIWYTMQVLAYVIGSQNNYCFKWACPKPRGYKMATSNSVIPPLVCPEKGSIVLCRVFSVGQAFAKVTILSVGSQVLKEPLIGIIRREEVRAAEKDKVSLFQSFRPRDIVQARVLGLGEGQAYTLTTAESELGVVLARSLCCSSYMTPVSWCEFQCTVTGKREKRKVAKVINSS